MRSFLFTSAVAVACAFAATPALADDPAAPPSDFTITGAASVVSQYRFRGISQSDNRPAVQGTFTVAHKSGFYISTWGSSATADKAGIVDIGGTEIDVYGGYTHAIGKSGFTIDVGLYGYIYPGATPFNYYEVYGSVSKTYGPVTAKVGVNVAPSQDNVFKTNTYVYGELSGAIPHTPFTIHTHLGHTGGAFDYVGKQYLDYTAGISYKWKALTFDISAVGTNISKHDARVFTDFNFDPFVPTAGQYRRLAKGTAVGSITASF
jgi:uncharacterized protein (TIGR02001 family)